MGDPQPLAQEALKPDTDELNRRQAASSDSDGSASIDEDDMSESGSENYYEPTRRGGSRRIANKSPMRKRRKRPEWTRNENIWHSTLRSKHLKARSLLRAYATALNGRWDDETARHEAYTAALRQHTVSAGGTDPSTGALEGGGLRDMAFNQDDDTQTPRMGSVQAGAGTIVAQTPDNNQSPAAVLARNRGGRGPPATAPRPLANDRVTGRGGQHRHQHPDNPRVPPSPTSCPTKAMQGVVALHNTSWPIFQPLRFKLQLVQAAVAELWLPVTSLVVIGHAMEESLVPNLNASTEGSADPSPGPLLGFDSLETWIGRLDPSIMLQDDDPGAREQLCRGGADSTSSSVAPAVSAPAPAAAAGGPGDVPGALQPTVANTSASGELVESGRSRLLTWPRPEQRLLGPPNTATHYGRAGPASGAWSSNSGAGVPQLQPSPTEGGINLHHAGSQAAAPNLSTAMAISPTARGGADVFSGGNGSAQGSGAVERLSPAAGHWHTSITAATVHGSHDRTLASPYGLSAAAVYAPPPGMITGSEGCGWATSPGGWALGAPRPPLPFTGRPVALGLSHEAWRSELPAPQELGIRPVPPADMRGGMYMVPVHAPAQPIPHMVYASPQPHVPPSLGQQHCNNFNSAQRLRQQEQIVYQQQQQCLHHHHHQYHQQRQEHQQQLRYHNHEQYKEQHQQTLAYQQAGQQEQQYQQQSQQFKQEPQGEQLHQHSEAANQSQQQHLLQHPLTNVPLALSQHHQQQVLEQQQAQSSHLEQKLPTQQQSQVQQLEQHADSLSSSEVVTMGLESLQDPQLRWCLLDME
ncbi:hypothetical protein VOLCADRAFT_96237 [Volvox carteri f. nagariensis]|uniref:Uncharacterized protein n=1 Tax=Volvox carteri f. nagariensis TaxID=3068 RepID=D8U9K7_VOLCA|nr:uncharacterized protein VOLCADRAFT_96237 [Volvox carteri f. nagariensis]EFJ43660.1 hypothetical protein VOLCADRAFT_96237 [Volvox carteri f. nagariensis]|eukprot:XP_002955360.1 hypothetical protein VOLCADRAFT_96237 [Volvox carteri f. nagariensis]